LYEEESEVDIELANRDMTLRNIGVSFTKDYIKRAYYLTDADFEIGAPPVELPVLNNSVPPVESNPVKPSDIAAEENEFADTTKEGQGVVDVVADKIVRESKKMLDGLTKPIVDFINNSGSFEDALDGLAEIYPKLDTDELYNKLVNLQFAADLVGRFEVRSELGLKQ
jgi:phage gp29-like protein